MKNLTKKERIVAIAKISTMTFKLAPLAVLIQVFSSILNAVLPIVTTYFAALTTTALAEAFIGDESAGQRVILYVIITIVLGVLVSAWSSVETYIKRMLNYKLDVAISDKMYEHFLRLEFWRYDDKDTIDNYEKASSFARYLPYIFSTFSSALSQIFVIITSLVAMILVSWWLGLILIIAIIPGFIIQFKLSKKRIAHWNKNIDIRRASGIIEGELREPRFIPEIRLYGMARYLLDNLKKLRDKDEKVRIEFERGFILKQIGANVVEASAEAVSVIWTVVQISQHALPIGTFVYVQQVVSRALTGSSGFIGAVNNIDEDLANLVEYQKFMDMPEDDFNQKRFNGRFKTIGINELSFSYPGSDVKVLDSVSMEITKGQHVAIVGENGAGKSTLIKILAGLYKPEIGNITLDGVLLWDYNTNSWHENIAVLHQNYISFDFATAKENVYFGDVSKPFDEERFNKAIDMAEIRKALEKLPKGVDNYVYKWMEDEYGNKGTDLSGGQWQRLALARNFYRNSPIIILDEPTSAIDALAEYRIFKNLFESKNKTIITISHRLSTIKKADCIYMMKDGKVVEQGLYEDLVSKKGEFYKMFKSQF